jgi:hypothetical protein
LEEQALSFYGVNEEEEEEENSYHENGGTFTVESESISDPDDPTRIPTIKSRKFDREETIRYFEREVLEGVGSGGRGFWWPSLSFVPWGKVLWN